MAQKLLKRVEDDPVLTRDARTLIKDIFGDAMKVKK